MQLLNQPYHQSDYLDFLVDRFRFSQSLAPITIADNDVKSFQRLGYITTADDKQLPVFEIHIKPHTQLARNRVQLRNLVAREIHSEDGALAVYVDEQNGQWRFSFIAIEWALTDEGIKETQTASKRFTYLLGVGAQTRTATERFSKLSKQSTLDDLKTAFAVEALNKEFYDKLYRWYERAQKQVVFPNDEGAENHTETSLIRLLTRLLFIWFLKEKKLINADLFNREKLAALIDYDKPSSFYKAILQNLFFATLNIEISKRIFRANKRFNGKNKDYGNQYRYRYHNLVKNEKKWKKLFSQTPFLNGGLFESLDRKLEEHLKDDKGNKIINAQDKQLIDNWNKNVRPEKNMLRAEGFSEHNNNPLSLKNSLFFNNENDLGLIDIFNQYQFTVEESTPLDVEVALDPELLGKVFENLLASYNPETGNQARKATGSFYTPREIVSYMVDESLKQHFKQHTRLNDAQISALFTEDQHDLTSEQIKTIITTIDSLKILDPAVGSGAFPMGILQRLVFILEKIDSENIHFKQQQIDKANELTDTQTRTTTLTNIETIFSKQNNYNAYGKKLVLIGNCIYGVDIQPIAILISQLRFFISLTIEQKTNAYKDKNFGIQPLPNLDYHFEVGNSLIGIPKDYSTQSIKDLLVAIKPLKHRFFTEANHDEKKKLKQKIDDKIKTCYQKMADAVGYTIDFDFKIDFSEMFESQNGFDIVLGNPPYIRQESIKAFKPQFQRDYRVFTGTADIYTYFYEKGFNLLSETGHLCYITSNKWMRAKYGEKLRLFFKNTAHLKQIIDFEGEQIFENATVDTNILLCGKQGDDSLHYAKQLPDEKNPLFTLPIADLSDNAYTLQAPEVLVLKKKIENIGTPLKEWDININYGIKTGFNEAFIINTAKKDELIATDPKSAEIIKPILRGRDIKAYEHHWAGLWVILAKYQSNKYVQEKYPAIYNHLLQYKEKLQKRGQCRYGGKGNQGQHHWLELDNNPSDTYLAEFEKEKIVYPIIASNPRFTYDTSRIYTNDKCFLITSNKNVLFLTAPLNSKLSFWYLKQMGSLLSSGGFEFRKIYVEQLPIPKIPSTAQQPFITLVDKILTAKAQNQDTTALETQIDKMVYQLYKLTVDEIKIIEAK